MDAKERKEFFVLVLILSAFLGGLGQLLFKFSFSSTSFILYLLLGVLLYGLSTLLYLYTLGRAHLGWTYGFAGLSYVFAGLFAFLFLNEPVSSLRWVGILVIAIGTLLVGLSSHR